MDPFSVFLILTGLGWAGLRVLALDQHGQLKPGGAFGVLRDIFQKPIRRLRIWRDAVAACGLSVEGSTSAWAWNPQLEAKAGSIQVRFEGIERAKLGSRIVVVIPELPGFSSVRIAHASESPGMAIGDEVFDGTFAISGPARLLCVLLDTEARRLLRRVGFKGRVEIAGGELRAEMFDAQVPFALPLLLDLGRRFAQEKDIVQCLVGNAQRDPEAGVRLSNLQVLVRECAWGARTEEALRIACSDRSPQVRVWAASELGPEGRGTLLALAEGIEDDECSAQAIRALGGELPFERTTVILKDAWHGHRRRTARACLEVLGGSGTAEAVDVLAEVLAQEEGEVGVAAAQALGTTGSAAGESPLIQALHREKMDLRVAAAKALGRVGSVAAVLPLKEAAERFSGEPDFAQATSQAIADIQYRLRSASPGQLSLAGTEAGQLSLAPAEAGQLSLATDPSGQLSLPREEAGRLSLSDEEGREPAPEGE